MFNPTYLCLSRHNVYYFRFPIPSILHPQGKMRDIKLSLQTRCPQEALYLGRALVYFADNAVKNPIVKAMDYHDIRSVLTDHFRGIRDKVKERIAKEGQLGDSFKKMCLDNQDWAKEALEHQDYAVVGGNEDISNLISRYDLPLKPDTKEFELFRIEYLKAYRDFYKSALDHNAEFDSFDFSTDPAAMAKATTHSKVKLADAIDRYIEHGLLNRKWKEKTERAYRSELNLMLEYMGQDCALHLSKQDIVSIIDMLGKIPKNPRGRKELQKLTIQELMATDKTKYPRMDLKTRKKYISRYGTFYEWAARHYDGLERNYFPDFLKDILVVDGLMLIDQSIEGREGFEEEFSSFYDKVFPELDEKERFLEIIHSIGAGERLKKKISMDEAFHMKLYCDAYFLNVYKSKIFAMAKNIKGDVVEEDIKFSSKGDDVSVDEQ